MNSQDHNTHKTIVYVDPIGGHRGMHYYDFELCTSLRAKGVDVTLLTCDETRHLALPPSLPIGFPFEGIYGGDSQLVRGLRYVRGLLRVALQMERQRIPLIHFHYVHVPPVDYLFAKWLRLRGKRVVFTAHDVTPFDAKPAHLGWLRRLYMTASAIITHADSNRATLIQAYHVDPHKVHVIPMGPYLRFAEAQSVSMAQARAHLGLKPDVPVVLFFGQIKKVKGLRTLLLAFRQVVEHLPDARLVIAGPEWKESFAGYAALIEELNLTDNVVTRIEYVPDEEVGLYFSASDLVALPYTEAYQSAVLYMAYSFAKPVVATTVGGLAEVIEDGVTGLLVAPAESEPLARAMLALLQDPPRARTMGMRGHQLVETKYGWLEIAGRTADVYTEVL